VRVLTVLNVTFVTLTNTTIGTKQMLMLDSIGHFLLPLPTVTAIFKVRSSLLFAETAKSLAAPVSVV
jgi:hypothetical protein